MLALGPPLDPDRELARRWLEDELSSDGYVLERSVVSRVLEWFADLLPSFDVPAQLPGWVSWVALAVVLLATVSVIAFAARRRWRRAQRASSAASGAVLEGDLSAQSYRDRAAAALADGDTDAALLDSYRALTAEAIERSLLDDRPGLTAHEVAQLLASPFPHQGTALVDTADRFDGVRYGDRGATHDEAAAAATLDQDLAAARPVLGETGPALEGARST